jgi:hypothetical protein
MKQPSRGFDGIHCHPICCHARAADKDIGIESDIVR